MRGADSQFVRACLRRETEYTPVWFMRQAGRYLPSYRRIKGARNVLDVAKDPELSSEAVVDAVRAIGADAGIIFADIMLPLEPMGVKLKIEEDVGPVISNPIRTADDVAALRRLDPKLDLPYVYSAIDRAIQKLDGETPLIGFSGAPFTLASYMIEGGPSRELSKTKSLMYSSPDTWEALMKSLTEMIRDYLSMQVRHGVSAVQLFDSWVGCLSPRDYHQFVYPFTREVFSSIGSVPKIHFCADSSALVEEFHGTGPEVLSVDWRVPIQDVWRRCSGETAVQGNLDPVAALAGGREMTDQVNSVLDGAEGRRGHIFGLGHGVLRGTDPENLRQIVKMVHSRTRRTNG
ncbi:MAG: uroporphyrinogen decarboxylase [Nitrososphaerota archaeon]|nr:uroporphyrinogen decarboxylase [Nitrososphaerota archaeon]MDG7023889.1 uroporphyrinogen decarboxylase [Nitrososphaerota archaeon]